MFGSLLDSRNHADTATSVGAAYDPAADRWDAAEKMPLTGSELSRKVQ